MSATQPIKSYKDVQRFKNYFLEKGDYRNYLFVSICLNTALRVRDVLSLKWSDVLNTSDGKIKQYISITEAKTQKTAVIKINSSICRALRLYIKHSNQDGEYLFSARNGKPITRADAFYIVKTAGEAIGLEHKISPHSLRKTFGYHAAQKGVAPAVLMQIFNHSSYEITKRYIGISQDEKDKVFKTVIL